MLELQAQTFLRVLTELGALIAVSRNLPGPDFVSDADRNGSLKTHIDALVVALSRSGAVSALASAGRLKDRIELPEIAITHGELSAALVDIQSRFNDHTADIKLFVMQSLEASLLEPSDKLLGFSGMPVVGFSGAFPNASFEIEEAGKSIAFERYTAAVFHCMRALEYGIKAIAKFLSISDPSKPAEKNWGFILGAIRSEIDAKYPKSGRLPNTAGARAELLYAQLDAVKNPWRNATMHVENVYAPHEALHIARCTGMFLLELMKLCDEDGIPASESPAKPTV